MATANPERHPGGSTTGLVRYLNAYAIEVEGTRARRLVEADDDVYHEFAQHVGRLIITDSESGSEGDEPPPPPLPPPPPPPRRSLQRQFSFSRIHLVDMSILSLAVSHAMRQYLWQYRHQTPVVALMCSSHLLLHISFIHNQVHRDHMQPDISRN